MSYKDDYEFGKQQEELIFPILQKKCKNIVRTLDRMNPWDAVSEKVVLEIKSRKFFANTFDTTMIKSDKIRKGLEDSRAVGFVFNFTDAIYVISLSKKFFNYEQKLMKVKDRDCITERYEWKTLIPMEDLTLLYSKDLFTDD